MVYEDCDCDRLGCPICDGDTPPVLSAYDWRAARDAYIASAVAYAQKGSSHVR